MLLKLLSLGLAFYWIIYRQAFLERFRWAFLIFAIIALGTFHHVVAWLSIPENLVGLLYLGLAIAVCLALEALVVLFPADHAVSSPVEAASAMQQKVVHEELSETDSFSESAENFLSSNSHTIRIGSIWPTFPISTGWHLGEIEESTGRYEVDLLETRFLFPDRLTLIMQEVPPKVKANTDWLMGIARCRVRQYQGEILEELLGNWHGVATAELSVKWLRQGHWEFGYQILFINHGYVIDIQRNSRSPLSKDKVHATQYFANEISINNGMKQADQLLGAAYQKVERGNWQQAKLLLEKALAESASLSGVHNEYALVLLHFGEGEKARTHILKAIELEPEEPKYWLALANWHFQQRQSDEALRSVAYAEMLDPSYPTIPVAKAHIAHELGAPPEKIREYQDQARKLYNARGTRADGKPLRIGDIDAFIFVKRKDGGSATA